MYLFLGESKLAEKKTREPPLSDPPCRLRDESSRVPPAGALGPGHPLSRGGGLDQGVEHAVQPRDGGLGPGPEKAKIRRGWGGGGGWGGAWGGWAGCWELGEGLEDEKANSFLRSSDGG